jgi:hypothetical protein
MTIEGQFMNDEIQKGRLTDRFGNVFTTMDDDTNPGRFIKGKLNGRVKILYSNSNTFIGYFYDGKRFGEGKMIYNNIMIAQEDEIDLGIKQSNKSNTKKHIPTETGEYEGMWKRD